MNSDHKPNLPDLLKFGEWAGTLRVRVAGLLIKAENNGQELPCPALDLLTAYVGKSSAATRPTQPFILSGSINE